jgi:hypothetical protein
MESKGIIKFFLILIILGGLISCKFIYNDMNTYAEVALDAFIAIILLTTGQQITGICFILFLKAFDKVNRFFKRDQEGKFDKIS